MSLGFHGLSYAWLAALALPVIVFYFLKLKRERTEVPSLALWRSVLEDRRVNSPLQRFRRNLLLWLQLLILAGLCLAALQPYTGGGDDEEKATPVVIDHGASMGARIAAGGPTRLDEAKRLVRERIASLPKSEKLCLVSFARDARQLTGFTDDRRELERALDRIAVEDVPSDPATALQLVQALARSHGFDQAELYSDGNLPERVDADLAFRLAYRRVGAPVPNLGITAFDARRRPDGRWEVFIAAEAGARAPEAAELEIRVGGEVAHRRALSPRADAAERVTFAVPGEAAVAIEARLVAAGFDALAADDVAYLALPAIRPLRAWVPPAMRSWRRALAAAEGVEVHPRAGGDAAGPWDLAIGDAATPPPEATVRVRDGGAPEALVAAVAVDEEGGAVVVDWRRSDPVLAHVSLEDLVVTQRPRYLPGASEKDLEAAGWEVLAHGDRGPLIARSSRSGATQIALLFASDRSTLPYRVGFPVLAANLAGIAMHAAGQSEARCLPTGVLPPLAFTPQAEVAVTGPGTATSLRCDGDGILSGVRASGAGLYQLASEARTVSLGAALLSPLETRLGAVEALRFREVAVAAGGAPIPGERAWWRWCALAALLVCLAEWWYFHRRPGALA